MMHSSSYVRLGTVIFLTAATLLAGSQRASATLLTDPNDPRDWQGATVETFRVAFGFATRQDVINAQILDDGTFTDPSGLTFGNYIGPTNIGASGFTPDPTNPPAYTIPSPLGYAAAANARDYHWVQDATGFDDLVNGSNVWDLGGQANQVAVFPIVDHGPLPQEAMEYSVYLSNNPNDSNGWTLALIDKVYLEGWQGGAATADGFTTVWRLPNAQTFQYVSVSALGPSALEPFYGTDDELDAVAGLTFKGDAIGPSVVPEPASLSLMGLGGLAGLISRRRRRKLA